MKLSMMSYERMQLDVSKQQNFSHRLGSDFILPRIIILKTSHYSRDNYTELQPSLRCQTPAII